MWLFSPGAEEISAAWLIRRMFATIVHSQEVKIMKFILIAFVSLVLLPASSILAAQNLQEPILLSAQLPQPAGDGDVKASFVLDTEGNVVSVEILTPRSDLGAAAEENIRSWKFKMPRDLYRTEWKYETTFHYHSREVPETEPLKLAVVFESFHSVDVTSEFKQISSRVTDIHPK
jgi:hypothetical protein